MPAAGAGAALAGALVALLIPRRSTATHDEPAVMAVPEAVAVVG